jgi:hypothetical protein
VGLERGPLSLVRMNEGLLEREVAAPVWRTEINGRREPPRWPRNTPLSAKVGIKIRRLVAVAQPI